jgi:hypothetical protein
MIIRKHIYDVGKIVIEWNSSDHYGCIIGYSGIYYTDEEQAIIGVDEI